MRTIAQVTPYYPPHLGGLERVVEHLCEELSGRHRVLVHTTDLGANGVPRLARSHGLTVHRHRAAEVAHTALSPGLPMALLRLPRHAVVHLHSAHAVLPELVALIARLRGQRYLLHFHLDVDASGPLGRLLPTYKKHVFGRVLRDAAGVIVLTRSQAEFVNTTYRVPDERIFVVPNGVGPEYFRPPRVIEEGPLRLLYVGRLSVQKNVSRLLEAMALVREPVRLRIVGDGELRDALRAQARQLGLSDVEFAGGLLDGELLEAYAGADALVMSSDKEGMPLVALEAMAASLPVVATDVPGITELLEGVGLLTAPAPEALAAAIDRLASEPGLRARLSAASAAAARGYSWSAVAERVEEVYTAVYGKDGS